MNPNPCAADVSATAAVRSLIMVAAEIYVRMIAMLAAENDQSVMQFQKI